MLSTPGYGDQAVAEHALALMMAAARNIARIDREIRAGVWRPTGGLQLRGRKLAVVGLGGITTTLAELALGLGMEVVGWNRSRREVPYFEPDLDEALRDADVVSLHLSLNAETAGLIDSRRLELPKRGFILANTARAQLVDEDAFFHGSAHAGLAMRLSMFSHEPLAARQSLCRSGERHPYRARSLYDG